VVRVDTLDEAGAASGVVVETLVSPTDEEWTKVYGPRRSAQTPPERLSFVGGLPGELIEVEARWTLPWLGRKPARRVPPPTVRVVAVREASPDRVAAPCPIFGVCGGCQLQHMAYPAQLAWKAERVRAVLAAVGFAAPPVLPAVGCEPPWRYRNHMRFSVNREGQLGLIARGSSRVLPLTECAIASERINTALAILSAEQLPRPQVLVRSGEATGQLLLQPEPSPDVRARLHALGLDVRDESLEEEVRGARFRIRPSSFFQTNTAQANVMADLVLGQLPAGPDITLVDAYCGVGTFARLMAARAGRVLAIEESASAIRDGRANLGDTPNVVIIAGKVEDVLPGVSERLDGLVIDPPRAGCARPVLGALIARRVPAVVYVSCDPQTLARDVAHLCLRSGAYRLVAVRPLDMFPQTAHIETVATLEAVTPLEAM
jgi:23S rRNA (uracil1939-C5)-methyltransferase